MMTEAEILQEIKNGDYENSILKALIQDRIIHINDLEAENMRCNATITAINKLNRGKNEDIDALCNPDEAAELRARQKFRVR